MQRILEPGEIEALDHNAIPRVRLPQRINIFSNRAQRLRQLAAGNPIGDYLKLMASLAETQQQALNELAREPDDQAQVQASNNLAQTHLMPLILATDQVRSPHWQAILDQLLEQLAKSTDLPPQLTQLIEHIRQSSPNQHDSQAEAILRRNNEIIDPASAPFYTAALQVICSDLVTRFQVRDVPLLDTPGLCPCCGSMPVASVVRMDGQSQGHRYLQCGMCAAEWHMVRIKCTYCDSTQGIAYQSIEDEQAAGAASAKAETCDACHSWLKIFYQEKDPYVEPVADDLASLTLDLLMGETAYVRRQGNPLLWQAAEG
ncbi:formate dehydrogenase formation protein FdhE [Collimonas arenae]|uniref:Protein FdhE homolog n=1 Tax=Collimonas arenae TaxID=279058 RepID=A0A0A1F8G3_9BURK|nr:formate dehydrogenase accessory protein FdhE [Collimonas arenae]AIY40070.1 formate dehydrogenase formation protein FdhE [Collimonas arenae]